MAYWEVVLLTRSRALGPLGRETHHVEAAGNDAVLAWLRALQAERADELLCPESNREMTEEEWEEATGGA